VSQAAGTLGVLIDRLRAFQHSSLVLRDSFRSVLVEFCTMDGCLEQHRGEFCISSDPDRLDLASIHDYLSKSYWSPEISTEVIKRAIEGSICFGLFHGPSQIGFARVITDRATFAYLCDVYVLDAYQRQGLGTWLMEVVISHPDLRGLRRFVLVTRDAHRLYERFGFLPLARPEGYMELHRPNIYSKY
jgi:GNAT superfamily N-acetyltransferase